MTLTLSLSALVPATAVGAGPPGSCPDILPVADLALDTFGRGWTVAKGHTPEPFSVEYLGVADDGIAAGRDLIIVQVSDVPGSHIIADANGIWAGISGSPVYSSGKLVGSVSYSLNAGQAFFAGVTPAEDMAKILDYPTGSRAAAGASRVTVTGALGAKLAARSGVPAGAGASFDRVRLPLAISGLSAARRTWFQDELAKAGTPVIVTPGSRAPSPSGGAFGVAKPGGNFAAMLSYGDISAGGIGTTTYVCNGQALAFGHPAFFSGRAAMGANDAEAIAIVPGLIGAFKLANVAAPLGLLDQDRLSGVRAELGTAPGLIAITSTATSLDLGTSRNGRTDVTTPLYLSTLTRSHLISMVDTTMDADGGGSAQLRWQVHGTRANGDPFELTRGNRYAVADGLWFYSTADLPADLQTILANPFEDVTIDDVSVTAKYTQEVDSYVLESVKVSRNGGPFKERQSLQLRIGDQVVVRAAIRRFRGDVRKVDVAFTVGPEALGVGTMIIGRQDFSFPSETVPGHDLDSMLTALRATPRNDDLQVSIESFTDTGFTQTPLGKRRLDAVVNGILTIPVSVTP